MKVALGIMWTFSGLSNLQVFLGIGTVCVDWAISCRVEGGPCVNRQRAPGKRQAVCHLKLYLPIAHWTCRTPPLPVRALQCQ